MTAQGEEKYLPRLYEQFFVGLDAKPEVKRAYFELQNLLAGTAEGLVERRRAGVHEMFTLGDTKAIDLERKRQAEQQLRRSQLWYYLLQERTHLGGKLYAFTAKYFQPIFETVETGGIGWERFREALFYEHIISGDRGEMANPRGISPDQAPAMYDALRRSWTPNSGAS